MLASLILLAAMVAGQRPGGEDWQVVAARDNKFHVELPDAPDQTSEMRVAGPAGALTLRETIRQTNGVIYLIDRVPLPGPFGPGDEQRWIDFATGRAGAWAGPGRPQVTAQGHAAGGVTNYRFAIEVHQAAGGTRHLKGRVVIDGDTLFLLVAVSANPNRPVPAQGTRFLNSFGLGVPPRGIATAEGVVRPGRRVATADGKATVQMPVKPTGRQQETEGEADGSREYGYEAEFGDFGGLGYALATAQSRPAFVGTPAEATVLAYARDKIAKQFGMRSKLVAERPARLGPATGVEFILTVDTFNAGPKPARGRAFTRNGTVYVALVLVVEKGGTLPAGEVARYLNSFAFLDRPNDAVVLGEQAAPANAPRPGGGPGPAAAVRQAGPAVAAQVGGLAVAPRAGMALLAVVAPRPLGLRLLDAARLAAAAPRARLGVAAAAPPADPEPIDLAAEFGPAPTEPAGAMAPPRAAAAIAAPRPLNPVVPWGRVVDPDGDVKFAPVGNSLAVTLPGTAHVLAPERGIMNAPRVVTPIGNDFVVSVRVGGAFRPSKGSTVAGLSSRAAGGLILWKDAANYLVVQHRATVGDDGAVEHQVVLEELVAGKKGAGARQTVADKPIVLNLERAGGRVTASFQVGIKDRKELKPVETTWAAGPAEVGVIAVSTSPGPHAVTFENFTFEAR